MRVQRRKLIFHVIVVVRARTMQSIKYIYYYTSGARGKWKRNTIERLRRNHGGGADFSRCFPRARNRLLLRPSRRNVYTSSRRCDIIQYYRRRIISLSVMRRRAAAHDAAVATGRGKRERAFGTSTK